MEALFGLSHSLPELESLRSSIACFSLEEQAEYADGVCRRMHKDLEFLRNNIYDEGDPAAERYNLWNATSVGNLAFLYLNSPLTPSQKKSLETQLQGYANYVSTL